MTAPAATTTRDLTGTEDPEALFVYGTLRPGNPLAHQLQGLPHTAELASLPGWQLYGRRASFPYAIEVPGPAQAVTGDLLTFYPDAWPEALKRADRIEGFPTHYTRELVEVHLIGRGESRLAWVYTPAAEVAEWVLRQADVIPTGDWNRRWER